MLRVATVAAVAFAGCGPASSSPPATVSTPSPILSPSAAQTAASSAPSSPTNAEGYRVLSLPAAAVRTVPLEANFRFHRLDSAGSLVVIDELQPGDTPTNARAIILVDLAAGTWRQLEAAAAGYQPWDPRISGRTVVWVEWHYESPNNTGLADWRLKMQRVDEPDATTIASGVQRRTLAHYGASWPKAAIDGDLVAYSVEDSTHPPDGWMIVVYSLSRRAVVRTISTDQAVYDLAISDGAIAYTVGAVDPNLGFLYDTRLLLSTPDQPAPRQLAVNAYAVRFRDGRIAWGQDTPTQVSGAAQGTRIWSTSLADLRPVPVSPPPGRGTEQQQAWPATGDGLVSWASFRLDTATPANNGERLGVWSLTSALAYEVLPSPGATLTGIADGWLVWINDRFAPNPVQTVSGIRLASLPLP